LLYAVLAILGCLLFIGGLKVAFAWQRPSVPILVYHDVLDASEARRDDLSRNAPVLSPEAFESNLVYLRRAGYETVTLEEVADFVNGRGALPPKPIAITFDDGWEGVYRHAYPLLAKYKMKATVFVIAGQVQDPQRRQPFTTERLTMLDWDQVRKMDASDLIDIESHTYDLHRRSGPGSAPSDYPVAISRLATGDAIETDAAYRKRLADDFEAAERVFAAELKRRPRFVAWPYGAYNSVALETAKSRGYIATFTIDYGVGCAGDDLLRLRRVSLSEHGTPDVEGAIREARYAPEIYSLKQCVKALLRIPNDP